MPLGKESLHDLRGIRRKKVKRSRIIYKNRHGFGVLGGQQERLQGAAQLRRRRQKDADEFQNSRFLRSIMPFQHPRRVGCLHDERTEHLRQIEFIIFVCCLITHELPLAFVLFTSATDLRRKPPITSCL
jgi:hypothetical protein